MWGLLFRMPWWVYFALAPLAVAGAGYTWLDDRHAEAEKAAALRQSPPAPVAIEAFDPARNVARAGEVMVTGQVDFTDAMELTETKRGVEEHHWTIAPIYPASAADTAAPATGVFVHDGAISDEQIKRMVTGTGPVGPVLKIDGLRRTDDTTEQAVRKGLTKIRTVDAPLLVDPFVAGRSAGLAPSTAGLSLAIGLLVLAMVLGGVGAFRRSIRPMPEQLDKHAMPSRPAL